MSDSPSALPQTDYNAAAKAQGASNLETAKAQGIINNPNVITPYGTQQVTWGAPAFDQGGYDAANAKYQSDLTSYNNGAADPLYGRFGGEDGTTPMWGGQRGAAPTAPDRAQFMGTGAQQPTVTQTLNPAQQKLLDSQTGISQGLLDTGKQALGYAQDSLSKPFDMSSVQDIYDRAYKAQTARLDPQWQQAQTSQETQLTNQGLRPGTEAWDNAMRVFGQQKNDAYQQAENAAIGTMPQTYGLARQAYTQPLDIVNALRSGSQVQQPTFQPYQGSSVGQTPIMQGATAQGQQAMNGYNQQVATDNANTQGMYSLAGAGIAALMF